MKHLTAEKAVNDTVHDLFKDLADILHSMEESIKKHLEKIDFQNIPHKPERENGQKQIE